MQLHSTGINTSNRVRIGSIHDYHRVQPPAHISWSASSPAGVIASVSPRSDGFPALPDFLATGKETPSEFLVAAPSEVKVGSTWFVDTMEFGPTHPIKDDMWSAFSLALLLPYGVGSSSVTGECV